VEGIGRGHAAADLVQELNIQQLFGPTLCIGYFFAHQPSSRSFILQLLSNRSPVTLILIVVPV